MTSARRLASQEGVHRGAAGDAVAQRPDAVQRRRQRQRPLQRQAAQVAEAVSRFRLAGEPRRSRAVEAQEHRQLRQRTGAGDGVEHAVAVAIGARFTVLLPSAGGRG